MQEEAITTALTSPHLGKREMYNALTGQEYTQCQRENPDPAVITPENFDTLYIITKKAKRGYLGRNLPTYYGPMLDKMLAAYRDDDIVEFKKAADDLISRIVSE